MIQFNLLPDVKIEYIKARQQRRMVTLTASGTIIFCAIVLIVLLSVVFVGQKIRLASLDKSIKVVAEDIKSKPDINKVLTIQNQLSAIDALHNDKPEVGRVFGYVSQITPSKITIQTLNVNFAEPTVAFTGQAPSLEEVNKFVDTLKFTTITRSEEGGDSSQKAFSQVVLSSFSRDDNGASFTISLNYDTAIFNSEETKLTLTVPKITTTRSETERPAELFKENQTPLPQEDN